MSEKQEYRFHVGPPPCYLIFMDVPHCDEDGLTTITHGLSHSTAKRLRLELANCLDTVFMAEVSQPKGEKE